jgi:uncharacterized membrane protein
VKIKAKWIWLVGVLSGLAAAAVAFFLGRKRIEEQAKQDASKDLAENLKAKVAEIKAAAAERKAETDVAVGKVDEAAKVDADRDSVELANDLIRGKGG